LDLFILADEIESGRKTPPARSMRLICPSCGTEYGGPEYRSGDPCLTVGCVGEIARKSDLARTKDGTVLPTTVDHMASQNALADFLLAADWQPDGNEWPHITRNSGGR
jgi:hypothetical protein